MIIGRTALEYPLYHRLSTVGVTFQDSITRTCDIFSDVLMEKALKRMHVSLESTIVTFKVYLTFSILFYSIILYVTIYY